MTPLLVCLLVVCLLVVCLLVLRALYLKGDVTAMFKLAFLTFALEAKEKVNPPVRRRRTCDKLARRRVATINDARLECLEQMQVDLAKSTLKE